jgi:hypothetical protein
MKELTEEKKENENENEKQQNNGVMFESMNISVGDIFPKKHGSFSIYQKIINIKNLIFCLVFLLVIFIVIIITTNLKNINNNYRCIIGKEDKCLLCDNSRTNCLKCNPGYKLADGTCILNYSIKAIYNTDKKNENLKLINTIPNNIIEMYIDDRYIEPCTNYIFESPGNHSVYILLNNSNLVLNKLFYGVNKMTYINYTYLFNPGNLKDISYMFKGCKSLVSLDLCFLVRNLLGFSDFGQNYALFTKRPKNYTLFH